MNMYEIYISCNDPKVKAKKIESGLEKVLKDLACEEAVSVSKAKGAYKFVAQIESNNLDGDAMERLLAYTFLLPKMTGDYIECQHDSSGERTFFTLVSDQLFSFNREEDLKDFLVSSPYRTVENDFYQAFADAKNLMFLRLRIKAKRKREKLVSYIGQFIQAKSDANLEALSDFFCSSLNESKQDNYYCSFLIERDLKGEERDFLSIFKSLCFCEEKDQYIYLGFNSDSINNVIEECWQADLELPKVVCVFMRVSDSLSGKARSEKLSSQDHEWQIEMVDEATQFCFEKQKLPENLWP